MNDNHQMTMIRRFGLNPKDWIITKQTKIGPTKERVSLIHREEPGLQLIGILSTTIGLKVPNKHILQLRLVGF